MRLRTYLGIIVVFFAIPLVAGADMVIGVSILPEKYFVEKIAGNDVSVVVMVSPGFNPVTYEPKPKQLSALSKASAYFLAGVPFERKWIPVFEKTNPDMHLVPLTENIKLRKFSDNELHDHQLEDQHGGIDPHFWLNPLLVKIAAKSILDTLVKIDPVHKDLFQRNYLFFVAELESLDHEIKRNISRTKMKKFAVFHPSWGYFAEAYGLTQIAIQVQNRQSGAKQLNRTINEIRESGIKAIFVQAQFSVSDASMIARQTGAHLILVDPLAENYSENLRKVSVLFLETLS